MSNKENHKNTIGIRVKEATKRDSSKTNTFALEQALKTVENFALSHKTETLPNIEHFEVEGSALQVQHKTTLEKTISFTKDCLVRAFSYEKRMAQEIRRKAIEGALEHSRDMINTMIKDYFSSQKEAQSREEYTLAERMFQAAVSYNEAIRHARKAPDTITHRIKKFFFAVAGWELKSEIVEKEIDIPVKIALAESSKNNKDSIHTHKITSVVKDQTTRKIASLIQSAHVLTEYEKSLPKICEIDAFRIKAQSLLSQEPELKTLTLEERLSLVHTHAVTLRSRELQGDEANENNIEVELEQTIIFFPGDEFRISGTFNRDPLMPHVISPIKDSFHITKCNHTPRFPDPLQYVGFSFSDVFLPEKLKNYELFPTFASLLQLKMLVNKKIQSEQPYIKEFFRRRQEVLRKNQSLFLSFLKDLAYTWVVLPQKKTPDEEIEKNFKLLFMELSKRKYAIEEVADLHRQTIKKYFITPLESYSKSISFKIHDATSLYQQILKEIHTCISTNASILHTASITQKQTLDWLKQNYQILIATLFSSPLAALYTNARCLEKGTAIPLKEIDYIFLKSLFRQQMIFSNSILQKSIPSEHEIFDTLRLHMHEELALFQNIDSQDDITLKAQAIIEEIHNFSTLKK